MEPRVRHFSKAFSLRDRLRILLGADVFFSVNIEKPSYHRWMINAGYFELYQTVIDLNSQFNGSNNS